MKQRTPWSGLSFAGLGALAGGGSASDPDSDFGRSWGEFVANQAVTNAIYARCFTQDNKEGSAIQLCLDGLGSGALSPTEYDNGIAVSRDWSVRVFSLRKAANDKGPNNNNRAGEIAGAMALLASPVPDCVNGVALPVDDEWLGRR